MQIPRNNHIFHFSRKLYYLTKKGKSLLPILREMLVWGEKYLPEKTEVMKPIFERLKKDEKGFVKEILGRLRKWEKEYLPD